ncbi:MAG: hypothetical protein HN742_28845 [Lentisphaerae bacterium]|jgi:hypothetical protein|nr:hypothetical protein [Lentisphaerota bacterium]MBT4820699.1 hypothetical protein [Lentisphaerota bacterium]MBT5611876.1 hypothetical protein [Lentisphaerota bacterium]MBT7054959.1 hypothetical protein [Lentisphaerota bacterium]MBT7845915.1 hypothetical protein [Lentisphaerota bacterium]
MPQRLTTVTGSIPRRLAVLPWIAAVLVGPPSITALGAPEPVACIQVQADRLAMHTRPGCYYEQRLASGFTRPANGHHVLHLDLPGRNFLPPELTTPGSAAAALATPELGQLGSGCPAGDKTLVLGPNTVWQSPAVPVTHTFQMSQRFGLIFSVYARAVEANDGIPMTLGVVWQPEQPPSKKANRRKPRPPPDKAAVFPEETAEQQATVGPEWQRIAVMVEQKRAKVYGKARVRVSSPAAVEIGGLQLEPWGDYPAYHTEPSAWMPGGTVRRPDVPATLPACHLPMDWAQGAVSLRVRVPDVFGGRVTGERTILFVARFWGGVLELNTVRSWVGDAKLNTQALQTMLADGEEHLLILTWDSTRAHFYADGGLLSQGKLTKSPDLDAKARMSYRIWIGTHNPRRRTIGGDIRDLRFYDQYLDAAQIAQLPDAPGLPAYASAPCITPPPRRVFRRDEDLVRLLVPIRGQTIPDTVVRLDGMPKAEARIVQENGQTALTLSFRPWQCSVGERECTIVLVQPDMPELRVLWPVHIMPAAARDRYTVGNWGGVGTLKALRWAKDLGLGLVDSRNHSAGYLNQIGLLGLRACVNFRTIQANPHPATHAHLNRLELQASRLAEALADFPWVTTCIHNSEGQGNDDIAASPAAMAALKTDLGLDTPPVPPQSGWADLAVRPKVDLRQFAETGIVPDDYGPLRYITWLLRKGDGMNLASAVTADAVRSAAAHVRMVQEPARPHYASWADALSSWRYANSPAPMLTVWRKGLGAARSIGKPYYPLTGHAYYSPRMFLKENGKQVSVPPSGDMAAAFLWTGLAMPADEVRCFGFWEKDWKRQERLRPGSHARIALAIAEIQRLGCVVGNVPHTRAPLAVLLSETNRFGRAAEEWWHAMSTRMYRAGTVFDEHDLPVDYLYENSVRRGDLANYRHLYVPALRYLPASIDSAVQQWRRDGGQLTLDTAANPGFEADLRADFVLDKAPWVDTARCEAWTVDFRSRLAPYARLEGGQAIVISKHCADTHFVFVINNKWTETTFATELTGVDGRSDIVDIERELRESEPVKRQLSSRLFDVGAEQTVTISLCEAPEAVVYDLRAGRRLTSVAAADGRLSMPLRLAPGSAAVLAVYRQAPAALELDIAPQLRQGKAPLLRATLKGADGQLLQSRHGLELTVNRADGMRCDASAVYCLENGSTSIPLRLPLDAPVGTWQIDARELASGLTATATVEVARRTDSSGATEEQP